MYNTINNIDAINSIFSHHNTNTIGSYHGKHILERFTGQYISEDDFKTLMENAGFKIYRNNKYKAKIYTKKNFIIEK